MIEKNNNYEISALKELEKQYFQADNDIKKSVDYWNPLNNIIFESIELRDMQGLSQKDLAVKMETKQSVISRFENMGRIPNYDFIAKLSFSLGHSPGITLFGDYMAIVPLEKQKIIKDMADMENISTRKYVQSMLDRSILDESDSYNKYNEITADGTFETESKIPLKENLDSNQSSLQSAAKIQIYTAAENFANAA